jgi:hypothetical protein
VVAYLSNPVFLVLEVLFLVFVPTHAMPDVRACRKAAWQQYAENSLSYIIQVFIKKSLRMQKVRR